MLRSVLVAGGVLIAAVMAGWAGLRVKPSPLSPPDGDMKSLQTIVLPDDLPPPVDRFYHVLYGNDVPVIPAGIISGRGTMRVSGLTLPVRFRFMHEVGQNFRHMIDVTIYGQKVMTVDERYVDGSARLELPFGVSSGPNIDQGANLAMWAEMIWMPAVWLTDPRVRWEATDDSTAVLVVPFEHTEERFNVYFDGNTGLISRMETMRFKGEKDSEKIQWIVEVLRWEMIDGRLLPAVTTLTWADEGDPWARLDTDWVVYVPDVGEYFT